MSEQIFLIIERAGKIGAVNGIELRIEAVAGALAILIAAATGARGSRARCLVLRPPT